MALAADIFSYALILMGALFIVIGGVGFLRLPDFYTRLHAASLTDSMGAPLVIFGLMFHTGWSLLTVKLLLLLMFLLLTSPTATHALAKAALLSGLQPFAGGAPQQKPQKGRVSSPVTASKGAGDE